MKCLILHTSYRKGNTYRVSEFIKSYMQTNGPVDFEEIFLSNLNLPFCMGCNECFLKSENHCPHNAIIQPIVKKIIGYDGLIITTPTYSLQVPAVLKCWLDHMSYNFHRPRFFNKKALVIVTTAGAGAKPTARYLKEVLQFWGINHISLLPLRCFSFNYIPNQEALEQISQSANDFYKEISSNKRHKPNLKQIFIFNLWRSMAKSGQAENTADYLYWRNMDLLDKSYPPEIPLGYTKKVWAAFAHRCGRKMIR